MFLTLTPDVGHKPTPPDTDECKLPGQKGFAEAAMALVSSYDFGWTDVEMAKFQQLSKQLNCPLPSVRQAIVYLIIYVTENRDEIAVAKIPEILSRFPIKWGYKKKRHDFLKTIQEMDFLYVQVNYWAKIRAKKYGVAKSGLNIIARIVRALSGRTSPPKAS